MKDKIIKAIENNIKAHSIAIEYTADEILASQRELLLDYTKQLKKQGTLTSGQNERKLVKKYLSNNCG